MQNSYNMKPITVKFPYNPLLSHMDFLSDGKGFGELTLHFKKKKGKEARTYEVSVQTAYKMIYCKSSADVMATFNEHIKNKARVINVKAE